MTPSAAMRSGAKTIDLEPCFTASSHKLSYSNQRINILGFNHGNPVIVLGYDPSWPGIFQPHRERIANALGDMAAAIEHVGSTAVPGLTAKPMIDVDVLFLSETMLPAAIECLASLGDVHRGDLGIPEREALFSPANDPPHHLYVAHHPVQSFEGTLRSEIISAPKSDWWTNQRQSRTDSEPTQASTLFLAPYFHFPSPSTMVM